jgi:hypothetical protein
VCFSFSPACALFVARVSSGVIFPTSWNFLGVLLGNHNNHHRPRGIIKVKCKIKKKKATQLSITPTVAVVAAHITHHTPLHHHSKVHPPNTRGGMAHEDGKLKIDKVKGKVEISTFVILMRGRSLLVVANESCHRRLPPWPKGSIDRFYRNVSSLESRSDPIEMRLLLQAVG